MTRNPALIRIESAIAATLNVAVEVTVSESRARGMFVSVFGMPAAVDAAREVLGLVDTLTFTDRDIDDEDPEVVDFYSIAA